MFFKTNKYIFLGNTNQYWRSNRMKKHNNKEIDQIDRLEMEFKEKEKLK